MKKETQNKRDPKDQDFINLYELWIVLWRRKYMIVLIIALSVATATIASYIIPETYRALTTVFPVSPTQSMSSTGEMMPLGFVPFGNVDYDINKIMALLKSNQLRINVIKKLKLFGLKREEDIDNDVARYNLVNRLNQMTVVGYDKDSDIITISIFSPNAVQARDIANTYVNELNNLLNKGAIMATSKKLEFLEEQMVEAQNRLNEQKMLMVQFQKKTKINLPEEDRKLSMDIYSKLVSAKIKLQIDLQNLESALAPDNPEVRAIRNQIRSIDNRLAEFEQSSTMGALPSLKNTPEKLAEYNEINRNLQLTEKFYETLLKLFEQTKFVRAHENPYVQVIDPAYTPVQRAKPQRRLMIVASAVGSLFFSIFLAFLLEWLESVGVIERLHRSEILARLTGRLKRPGQL